MEFVGAHHLTFEPIARSRVISADDGLTGPFTTTSRNVG